MCRLQLKCAYNRCMGMHEIRHSMMKPNGMIQTHHTKSPMVDNVWHAQQCSTADKTKPRKHHISFGIASRSNVIVCRLLSTFICISFHIEILNEFNRYAKCEWKKKENNTKLCKRKRNQRENASKHSNIWLPFITQVLLLTNFTCWLHIFNFGWLAYSVLCTNVQTDCNVTEQYFRIVEFPFVIHLNRKHLYRQRFKLFEWIKSWKFIYRITCSWYVCLSYNVLNTIWTIENKMQTIFVCFQR